MSNAVTRIAFVPRSTSGCIDLALRTFAMFLAPLMALTGVWLVLTLIPIAILLIRFDGDLRHTIGCLMVTTLPLGAMIAGGMGRLSLGLPLRFAIRDIGLVFRSPILLTRLVMLIGYAIVLMIPDFGVAFALVMFGLLIIVPITGLTMYSFEKLVLADLQTRHFGEAWNVSDRLGKRPGIELNETTGRAAALLTFGAILFAVLLATLETLSALLFRQAILFELLPDTLDDSPAADQFLQSISVNAEIAAVFLLVYVMLRISVFYFFMDDRIRRDCWDTFLNITRAAQHLEDRA